MWRLSVLLLSILIVSCLIPERLLAQDLILRIPVTAEGIYRITYEELGYYGQPYGIDPKQIVPSQIHLYNRAQDVAIHIEGEEDTHFDPGDYIEFYGNPVGPKDPEYKYAEENIYWLRINTDPSVRMDKWCLGVTPCISGGTLQTTFLHTSHIEQNWYYWESMPNGENLDHWFWGRKITKGSKREYTFNLSNVAGTSQNATIRVYLHGRTDDAVNPDHKTQVSLNGAVLGDVIWDGEARKIYSFENVSHSLLNNGTNTVTFEEVGNPDATVDSIFVNWIEVDYYKTFVAEGNRLKFTARGNGTYNFSVSNFTSPSIMVLDVSDPLRVRRLSNPSVTYSGGTYTVKFSDDVSGEATYLVAVPKDVSYTFQLTTASLKATGNGADYIIITHSQFKDAVLPLAQHRERVGYRVKVVTTQDIYDEFSGGIFTPQAIKDFLKYAYENWNRPAPEFVLLVGDANLDYKDYWGTHQINYVPTYLVETTIVGETPSDHWFVTVAGNDPLPDMLIGRIPAKTAGEVSVMVNKIIAYETGATGAWRYRVMFSATDHTNLQNPLFQDPRFKDYSNEWITHIPSNYVPYRVYVGDYSDKVQSRIDLLNHLNDGVLITSYFGHGSVGVWMGGEGVELLTSEDAATLTNNEKPTFVVGFNCLNGLFAMPSEGVPFSLPDLSTILFYIPLPEALLRQDRRGALAMWSPSAFAYPSEQEWIGHELFSGIFEKGNNILGSVTTLAKVNAFIKNNIYVENLDVFTFFGDPATRLALDINRGDPSSGSGSGGGGCFIATAAYGSYLHPYVKILRDFRDQVLLQTVWGPSLVTVYYQFSPPVAEWLSERGWARGVVQFILLPVVFWAWLAVWASLKTQVLFLVLAILCGINIFAKDWRIFLTHLYNPCKK